MAAPESVDAYLAAFPATVRAVLDQVRAVIRSQLPDAVETISYGVPTYTMDGRHVIYFAGWARHVSVYPVPAGDPDLERRIAPYRAGRGTLRFSLAEPIPLDLVRDVARALARPHGES